MEQAIYDFMEKIYELLGPTALPIGLTLTPTAYATLFATILAKEAADTKLWEAYAQHRGTFEWHTHFGTVTVTRKD